VEGSLRTRAALAFSEVRKIEPADAEAFGMLRRLAAERGDHEALIELLEARSKLTSDREEQIELSRGLARSFHALKSTAKERTALERWLALDPEASAAWRGHAQACAELQDYPTAKASWLRFLESGPDSMARARAQY